MESKLQKIFSFIPVILISGLVLSCATPKSKPPIANYSEIQEETKKQRILVLKTQMEAQYKLNNVSSRVLAGASPFCSKKKLYSCFIFVHKEQFKQEYRDAAVELYSLKELPKVVYVSQDSTCEMADLKPGDEIISINDQPFPTVAGEIQKFVSFMATNKMLKMEVMRNSSRIPINIEQATCCDYPVILIDSNEVNAEADGEKIYVTRGLMRFVDNDSELANIISHELAHNTRGHISMTKKNALGWSLGGLILDIAAAAVGVNTQGAFSKAGMNIGSSLYSKDMEREADYVGLYLLALSGYSLNDAPNVFRRLGTANPKNIEGKYAASHPSTPERFINMEKTVEEILKKQSSGLPLVPEEKRK